MYKIIKCPVWERDKTAREHWVNVKLIEYVSKFCLVNTILWKCIVFVNCYVPGECIVLMLKRPGQLD